MTYTLTPREHRLLFILLALVIDVAGWAQTGQLTGLVVDAQTQEPLPFANVYVNTTTLGTTTDVTGHFTLKNIPVGSAEVVCSYLGYVPYQVKATITPDERRLDIQLTPDAAQLSEVEVKSGRDKVWERQLKKFEKVFLGNASDCTILNPWVIDFDEEKGELKAKASAPLEIENHQLGYRVFFQLRNFKHLHGAYSIVGTTRFVEMSAATGLEAITWMKNRTHAYQGSLRHLAKSILDRRIQSAGFTLYRELVRGKPRSKLFAAELAHNVVPLDTSLMADVAVFSSPYRIMIKDRVEVHYNYGFASVSYYTDVPYPVSWIEVSGGVIYVNADGNILNGTDVYVSGEMANSRVAEMLPLDYKPETIITIKPRKVFSAERLQENVYVQTDKPYYYPGDRIWFSAFLHYRSTGVKDTMSRVLYVDVLNSSEKIVRSAIVKIDSGRAWGSILLPAGMKPENYVLRAYTQWMRNYGVSQFFYQPIPVLNARDGVNDPSRPVVADQGARVTTDSREYKTRSAVAILLRLDSGALDELVHGTFSVSVVDEKLAVPIKEAYSIAKDYVQPVLSQEMLREFRFPIEHGITLEGICKGKKGKGKKTKLTFLPENLETVYVVPTLDDGSFSLRDLNIYDTAKFGVQPIDETIVIKDKDAPGAPAQLPTLNLHVLPLDVSYLPSGDTMASTLLREVKVTGKRETKSYDNAYAKPDFYITGESIETYQNLATAIAAKIPDFKLILYDAHWYLIRRRGEFTRADGAPAEPVLYVDGALIVGETAGDRLVLYNPAMIDHVEVSNMIGSNLGANGANGAVYIYSKRVTETPFKGLPVVMARGYDRVITFDSPHYDKGKTGDKPDHRSTLYWNPRVDVASNHGARLTFFTSDHPGTYRIIVEGVNSDGHAIHIESAIEVKDE